MNQLFKIFAEESTEITVTEPLETDNNTSHRSIIIIGAGYAGLAFAHHLIHSCAPLLANDITEDVVICHPFLFADQQHPDTVTNDDLFERLVQETTFEITALKEEAFATMCNEYFEPRHQIIKNYSQPKVGRLNKNPKQIWWHRSHQRK